MLFQKKTFISLAVAAVLGTHAIAVDFGSMFNSGSMSGISSTFSNLTSGDLGSITKSAYSLYNSPFGQSFAQYWSMPGVSGFNGSSLDMCYNVNYNGANFPSMCGMFGMPGVSDPCSLLPSNNGILSKKSSSMSSSLSKNIGYGTSEMSNYCSQLMGAPNRNFSQAMQTPRVAYEAATEPVTINKENLDKRKAFDDGFSNGADRAKGNPTKTSVYNSPTAYMLMKEQAMLVGTQKPTQEQIESSVTAISEGKLTFPYKTAGEYDQYVETKANLIAISDMELNYFNHIEKNVKPYLQTINQKYASSPTQAAQERAAYVESYVEQTKDDAAKGGYRQQARLWAERKANEEIIYSLPHQYTQQTGGEYKTFPNIKNEAGEMTVNTAYSGFTQSKSGNNDAAKLQKTEAIFDANRQAYYEAKIKAKWFQMAEEKANELKRLLMKEVIRADFFDAQAALQETTNFITAPTTSSK